MVFDNLGGRIASHLARHWSRYLMYGATTAVGVAAAALLHRVPPTRGRKVVGHLGFIAVAVAICMLAPHDYQDVIFSPAGAAVAGVFFPVLESMRAVCSVTEEDDRRWLQYWLAQASFMVATSNLEWLVLNLFKSEAVRDVWFHMQVLFLLWLQLPWTDGSTLLYDTITKPFILPRIKGIAGRVSDSSLINTAWAWVINGSHLYGLYFVFVLMPGVVEKFIVDMVGTAYPLLASTVAVTTEDDPEDDTQWLVYWCVFSLFHVFASIVDDALDWIPGAARSASASERRLFTTVGVNRLPFGDADRDGPLHLGGRTRTCPPEP